MTDLIPSLFDLAERLVRSKGRKKLGMARGKAFISGAAPLSDPTSLAITSILFFLI